MKHPYCFDSDPLYLFWLRPCRIWVSIDGGWIRWFVTMERLTELGQLFQGRGHYFIGGRTPSLAIQFTLGQRISVEVLM